MGHVRVVVASLALLIGHADTARACICSRISFTLPANTTTGVPTNLRDIYYTGGESSILQLRAADGEVLDIAPTRPGPGPGVSIAAVPTELRPNMRYAVWSNHVGAYRPWLTFTTGDGRDEIAPPAPRFERFRIDYPAGVETSCGHETGGVEGYVVAPPNQNVEAVVLRFISDDGQTQERMVPPLPLGRLVATGEMVWFPAILGPDVCQIDLQIVDNATYLVEAWSIDRAGNVSEVTKQEFVVGGGGCASAPSGSFGSGLLVIGLALASRRRRRRT